MRKIYIILGVLIILLYAMLVLNQYNIVGFGDVFGYLFYVIIALGVIGVIWLLIKPTKKKD